MENPPDFVQGLDFKGEGGDPASVFTKLTLWADPCLLRSFWFLPDGPRAQGRTECQILHVCHGSGLPARGCEKEAQRPEQHTMEFCVPLWGYFLLIFYLF